MKITKVDVLHLKTNLKNGHWRPIVCRIYTDEGIYGDGEAALAYGESQIAAFGIVQNFAKLIIGMDPLQHEVIWDKLYRTTFWGQNGGPVIFAGISAIDIALWDIKGKYYNAPIYELLGGKRREKLRTYASQLQFSWGPTSSPSAPRTTTPARPRRPWPRATMPSRSTSLPSSRTRATSTTTTASACSARNICRCTRPA